MSRKIRIGLAASGGGHLRQLLDLRSFWEAHDTHFITEQTSLSESVSASNRMHYVPHVRIGQLRTHALPSVVASIFRNMRAAWRAVRSERPELIVSTGAGAVFFAVLFAKMNGARVILIESFARVKEPSIFGRIVRPLADLVVVQSGQLGRRWPDAEVFDPLVVLGPRHGQKEDLGLVTVGTLLPFDRLVNAVAALRKEHRPGRIVAQVGIGGASPPGIEVHESIDFDEMLKLLERAKVVFCHGGSGSLVTALRAGCRVVAMPRRRDLRENHDDHQQELVQAFAARGLIDVVNHAAEMEDALKKALEREPTFATTDTSALVERLKIAADEWFPMKASH